MLHFLKLFLMLKVIRAKFINWYYNNLLTKYFSINKSKKSIN